MFRRLGSRVFQRSYATFGSSLAQPRIPNSTLLYVGVGAGVGVLAIAAIQSVASTDAKSDRSTFASPVRRRLHYTYGYLTASLAGTAGAAAMLFRSGVAHRLMAVNPIVLGIGSLVATIGSMMLTRSIDYHESPIAKHLAFGTFIGCQALMMAPLAALGGPLLMRAAVATGAIVGSISLCAATAPSQAYLSMTGPLTIGAGLIMGASLGSMFFPGANFLYSIVMWGGLALHGSMVFYRTQGLIDGAQRFPTARFDPVNDAMGIYIDTLAIFWRMVMLMQGSQRRKT